MPIRHKFGKPPYAAQDINSEMPTRHNAAMAKRRLFLKEWRKFRGLNQEQLAERIGINQGHYSRIEQRKRPYDEEFLERAAEALRCEPADLLMRDPTDPEGIWSLWETLSVPERRQAITVIKALHDEPKTGTDG